MPDLIITERVERKIISVRGKKVILASDLAELYGVETRVLNQAVKRNLERFPPNFMFQLTKEEKREVVTNCDHLEKIKFSPTLPYAFTEHGALMSANVLNSPSAVQMSVLIVETFVKLREMALPTRDKQIIEKKMAEIQNKLDSHDDEIKDLFEMVQILLLKPTRKGKRKIGFDASGHRSES